MDHGSRDRPERPERRDGDDAVDPLVVSRELQRHRAAVRRAIDAHRAEGDELLHGV